MGLCLFGFAIGKFFPDMSDGAFPWNFSRLPVEWIMMDSHCISLHMFKVMLFTDYTMVNYHETPPFGKSFFFPSIQLTQIQVMDYQSFEIILELGNILGDTCGSCRCNHCAFNKNTRIFGSVVLFLWGLFKKLFQAQTLNVWTCIWYSVDGSEIRHPPVEWWFMPLFTTGFCKSQVVQDVFHQQPKSCR